MSDKFRRALIVNKFIPSLVDYGVEKFDVVEFAECGAEGLVYLQRKHRSPCVVRVHCPTQLLIEHNDRGHSLGNNLLVMAERMSSKRADMVTAPSRSAAAMASTRWKLTNSDPVVIPNLYNAVVFNVEKEWQNRKPFVIVYSGRIERLKGVMSFPEILSKLHSWGMDFEMRIIGQDTNTAPGHTSMREWLMRSCSPEVRQRVVFLGQLGEVVLAEELRKASVGLYLSAYETFGYTVLEAQACGVPVVASRCGGFEDIVVDGETGYIVDVNNIDNITQCLFHLYEDAELRRKLSCTSHARARDRFSVAGRINDVTNFYTAFAVS